MKLNIASDFAMRIIIELNKSKDPQSIPVLSQKLHIPYHHLVKLVQRLSKTGITQTKQGKYGGVCLKQPLSTISVRDVVDSIEGPTSMARCTANPSFCELDRNCTIKPLFQTVENRINEVLEDIKLGEFFKEKVKVSG